MKNIMKYVAAAAMLAVTAGTAQAQMVTYQTQYSCDNSAFSALGGGSITCTYNGVTLSFTGQDLTNVTAPSFNDFGSVVITGGTGTFTNNPIFLRVVQTGPTSGNFTFNGLLSGSVLSTTNSSAVLTYAQDVGTIGAVTYDIEADSKFNRTAINAQSTGPQTVRDFVTATPEPASMVLLGTGLVGLFGVARRKKNNA